MIIARNPNLHMEDYKTKYNNLVNHIKGILNDAQEGEDWSDELENIYEHLVNIGELPKE